MPNNLIGGIATGLKSVTKTDIKSTDVTNDFVSGNSDKIVCTDTNGNVASDLVRSYPSFSSPVDFVTQYGTATPGDRFFNTSDSNVYFYNGVNWCSESTLEYMSFGSTSTTSINNNVVQVPWNVANSTITGITVSGSGTTFTNTTSDKTFILDTKIHLHLQTNSSADNNTIYRFIKNNSLLYTSSHGAHVFTAGTSASRTSIAAQNIIELAPGDSFRVELVNINGAVTSALHSADFANLLFAHVIKCYI